MNGARNLRAGSKDEGLGPKMKGWEKMKGCEGIVECGLVILCCCKMKGWGCGLEFIPLQDEGL